MKRKILLAIAATAVAALFMSCQKNKVSSLELTEDAKSYLTKAAELGENFFKEIDEKADKNSDKISFADLSKLSWDGYDEKEHKKIEKDLTEYEKFLNKTLAEIKNHNLKKMLEASDKADELYEKIEDSNIEIYYDLQKKFDVLLEKDVALGYLLEQIFDTFPAQYFK